jgi:hypothetical protein
LNSCCCARSPTFNGVFLATMYKCLHFFRKENGVMTGTLKYFQGHTVQDCTALLHVSFARRSSGRGTCSVGSAALDLAGLFLGVVLCCMVRITAGLPWAFVGP